MELSRQRGIIIVATVSWAVSAITVLLRFISRQCVVRHVGSDDWFMLAAVAASCGYMIADSVSASLGLGKHVQDVSADDLKTIIQLILATGTLYHFAMFFAKASILAFYLRFIPQETNSRRACWALLVFLAVTMVVNIVVFVIPCIPLRKLWEPETEGTCINLEAYLYTSAAIGLVTDLIIFILPLRWVATIRRSRTERVLLFGLLGFSVLGCVVSILRLPSIQVFMRMSDLPWDAYYIVIWSHIEVAVCIICGSAPALKPLFMRLFRKHQLTASDTLTRELQLSKGFYDLNRRSITTVDSKITTNLCRTISSLDEVTPKISV